MRVFHDLDNLPKFNGAVATMGSFDGVHSGHQELLRRVSDLAKERAGESIVITFEPHPRYVLGTGENMRLLTTLDEKLLLLERAGIDNAIIITFTSSFSQKSPQEFIADLANAGIGSMVVGYNHRFGHRKEGDYNYLESRGGMELYMVEQQQVANSKVSSTIIRQAVSLGMMERAVALLGHPYLMECRITSDGEVCDIDQHKLLPPEGTHEAEIEGQHAVITVGDKGKISIAPVVATGKVMIEII